MRTKDVEGIHRNHFWMSAWFLDCREETSKAPYWAGAQDWPGQCRSNLCTQHNTEQLYLGELFRGERQSWEELWGDDVVQFVLLPQQAWFSWWVQAQKRGSVVCLLLSRVIKKLGVMEAWRSEPMWWVLFGSYVRSVACLQHPSLAVWISGMVPNTEFGFNTLFSLLFFQNVILSAKMH